MKLRSIRKTLVSGVVLMSPLVTFAGGPDSNKRMVSKSDMQNPGNLPQSVNQGKGAGITRNEPVLRGKAYRSQTAQDSPAPSDRRSNSGDTVFRK